MSCAPSPQLNKIECVRLGASVQPRRGNTALHLAALSGKDSMAELLLKHGADIDAKDKDGPGPGGRFCSVLVAWEWPEAFMG